MESGSKIGPSEETPLIESSRNGRRLPLTRERSRPQRQTRSSSTSKSKRKSVRFDVEDNNDSGDDDDDDGSSSASPSSSENKKSGKDETNSSEDALSISVTQAITKSFTIAKTIVDLLFANTSTWDKFILIVGSFFAFINGMVFPFVCVLFGSMTNSFVQLSITGYANTTYSTDSYTSGLYNYTKGILNESYGLDLDKPIGIPDSSEALGISEKLSKIFDLINKVVLETFTEHEALSKDEFIQYVHTTGELFVGLSIIVFISSFFQVLCWEWVAANQTFRLQRYVVRTILRQEIAWFENHDIGEIVANIFCEVGYVDSALGFKFGSIVQYSAIFVTTALIALVINWRLALVFLAAVPFIALLTLTLGKKLSKISTTAHAIREEAEDISSQYLRNVETVAAFGAQESSINEFETKYEEATDILFKKYHLAAIGKAVIAIAVYGSYAGAFWYSCKLLIEASISAGEIYTIFLSISMGVLAISNLTTSVTIIGTAYGSAKHLKEFGQPYPEIDCFGTSGRVKTRIDGDVEFTNINFSYASNKKVLNNLSFKIEAGQTVAIVGEAGAGKTTIAKLLLRLHDPNSGKVKIDSISVNKINVRNLRKHVGNALQEPRMNRKLIFDNIRAGRRYVTSEQIHRAMRIVDPETHLEVGDYEKAEYLPIYTRQKINLARSIVDEPPIVILDETFNDLQANQKNTIFKSVLKHRKGKTTIILTNDILSVSDVDTIYILKDGEILPVNTGSHAELLGRADSIYKYMYNDAILVEDFKNQSVFQLGSPNEEEEEEFSLSGAAGFCPEPAPEPTTTGAEKPTGLCAFYELSSLTKKMFGFGLLGCILTGAQLVIFAFYLVQIFGTFSKTGDELADEGIFWAGLLLVLALVSSLGIWLRTLFMSCAGLYLILNIRTTAFISILRRPICTEKNFRGPSVYGSQVSSNAPFIKNVLEHNLPEGLSTTVTLICIVILIFTLIWQIGLIVLGICLPILYLIAFVQLTIQTAEEKKIQANEDKTAELISDAVENIELVQSHNMQTYYLREYCKIMESVIKSKQKEAKILSLNFALCETMIFLFFGAIFLYGSYLISVDAIEPESLFKVFFSSAFCIVAFTQIVSLMPDFGKALNALNLINGIISKEFDYDETLDALNGNGEPCLEIEGTIEFKNVYFAYNSQSNTFEGLNLVVPAGSTTSIVGTSTFGGSTLCYLLERFYDVSSGAVLVDGRNIKNLNIGHLRQHIGWVLQDMSFFYGSISTNLKFGCSNQTSDDQLKEVLTTVKLIEEFGNDLHTIKEDHYWNSLPRGTKVLLAIARAILRNPKILLLDSPTSSMSSEEQLKIIQVIKEVKANRTCIIVAKISTTIELGDKIVFIDEGRVVEEGTLEQLLDLQSGYYSRWLRESQY